MGLADSRSTRLSELCMHNNVACQLCGCCSLGDPVAQGSPGVAGRRPAAWSSVPPTGTVTTCVCTRSVSVVACVGVPDPLPLEAYLGTAWLQLPLPLVDAE